GRERASSAERGEAVLEVADGLADVIGVFVWGTECCRERRDIGQFPGSSVEREQLRVGAVARDLLVVGGGRGPEAGEDPEVALRWRDQSRVPVDDRETGGRLEDIARVRFPVVQDEVLR